MLKALVTGGAGFIGSHLCAALLRGDTSVTCMDNMRTGAKANVAALLGDPGFTLLEHDVAEPITASIQPDLIFHLASPASVVDYLSMPLETFRANSMGTWNMLQLAEQTGSRFLFTSTSEIYGDPLVHPQAEEYWGNVSPVGPRACYDESKRFGEALTMEYARNLGLDARIVRIFNTYGPHSRLDDGRVIPNFIVQALRGGPLTIFGDGTQTRSLCFVSDLVAGIQSAMFTDGTRGEVFNLGNPDERSVLELANIIKNQVDRNLLLKHEALPIHDPVRRCPDITKAKRMLDWQPRIDLTDGLSRTIGWFRSMLRADAPVA